MKEQQLGIFLVLLGNILFSAKAIFAKMIYAYSVEPTTLITLRMAFSLPFFLVVVALFRPAKRQVSISGRDWWNFSLFAFLGYYGASLLNFIGLQYVSASLERLILFTYPALVLVLAALFQRVRITRVQAYALLLTYGGIAMALIPKMGDFLGNHFLFGALLVFASSLSFAIYLVRVGNYIHRFGSMLFTSIVMILATLMVFIHFLFFGHWQDLFLPMPVYGLFLGLSFLSTVLPVFMISEGIKRMGAGNMSIISSIGPISTMILAVLILHEQIVPLQIAGTLLVLAGVWMVGKQVAKGPSPVR